MPLTPHEASEKNKGHGHPQLIRAIQELLSEADKAVEDYAGEPVYVGLPVYLQYRVEADKALLTERVAPPGPRVLQIVDRELHDRYGPSGWKIAIVTNLSGSYCWAKLMDAQAD